MNDTQLPVAAPAAPSLPATLAVNDVLQQVALIQTVMREVMIPEHHYGVLPGTEAKDGEKKRPPMLFKPGAEKLCMVFRLAPTFQVRTINLQGAHREERVTCTLTHIPSGSVVATADGSCSTLESKYRYRNGKPKCPDCGAETIFRSKKEAEWFCWKQKGGCGSTFPMSDQRIRSQSIGLTENKDIADQYNTVLKMACKRALVAATLLATAASDMFVVEEDHEDEKEPEEPEPAKKAQKVKVEDPPAEKPRDLTQKEVLIQACAKAKRALSRSPEAIAEILLEAGVTPPSKNWSELDEDGLTKAKAALEAELALGAPVGGK